MQVSRRQTLAFAAGLVGCRTDPPSPAAETKGAALSAAPAALKDARIVERLVDAQLTRDGAGVKLNRALGGRALPMLDPFLMLDEFHSDDPNDYAAGFPDHPHRGFETVTYML